MKSFFNKIYAYFVFVTANDWRIIWADSAQWVDSRNKTIARSHYMIEYSLKRNMFRLQMQGHRPQEHSYYPTVLKKIAEYNQKVLSKEFNKNESK